MTDYVTTQATEDFPSIQLPISDLAMTVEWTGDNATTFSVVFNGVTYEQTFTYNGSDQFTGNSQWVPQS